MITNIKIWVAIKARLGCDTERASTYQELAEGNPVEMLNFLHSRNQEICEPFRVAFLNDRTNFPHLQQEIFLVLYYETVPNSKGEGDP